MEDTITTHYHLCEEFLKAAGHRDDPQARPSTAEVMAIALTASAFFGGDTERGRTFLHEHGHMMSMLSKSRPNRRLRAIPKHLWESLSPMLASVFKKGNAPSEYVADSFPAAVRQNARVGRSRLCAGGAFRGYAASGKRYFYGLRVHMLVGAHRGEPVEFHLEPGSTNDKPPFRGFGPDLPEGSIVYADKQYNDYHYEDLLKEAASIEMEPLRKRNSKRPFAACVEYVQKRRRKRVETSFSQIVDMSPRRIHAVRAKGFELEIVCSILAFAIQFL